MNWLHRLRQLNQVKNQAGLTLVELLIALAITVFMGFVIFELLSGSMLDYNRTAASSNLMADTNIALSRLGQDIRLAQNPNQHTKAVVVSSDHTCIDVYRIDDSNSTYQRISYLVEEVSQDGQIIYRLKRGVVETDDPGSDENPQYGTIDNWQILLEGLKSKAVFYDLTGDDVSDRRLVEVNLNFKDINTTAECADFHIKTSFMSRSQPLNALTGSGGSSLVKVTGVIVNPTTKDVGSSKSTFTATAQVTPSNASNPSVHWTVISDGNWLSVDNSDSSQIEVSVKRNRGRDRTGYLTVTTQDGGHTETITVNQNGS